jgi:hypothetical protein
MTDFQNLFEACGKFYRPGKEPQGNPIPPRTPPHFEPSRPKPTIPVFPNIGDPGDPLYKCEIIEIEFCPEPFGNTVFRNIRKCEPCVDENGNHITSVFTAPVGYEECVYKEPDCTDDGEEPCISDQFVCPQQQRYRCEETYVDCEPGTISTNPAGSSFKQVLRECKACGPGDSGCVYLDSDCTTNLAGAPSPGASVTLTECVNGPLFDCVGLANGGPKVPAASLSPNGGGGAGKVVLAPVTGAGYKCVTKKQLCPPGTTNAGSFIRIESRACEPCFLGDQPASPTGTPGNFQPQTATKPAVVTPATITEETPCQNININVCPVVCPPINNTGPITQLVAFCNEEPGSVSLSDPEPPNSSDTNPITPDPDGTRFGRLNAAPGTTAGFSNTDNPFNSVTAPAQQLLNIQERNSTILETNKTLLEEDRNDLNNLNITQNLYHPRFTFFNTEPESTLRFVTNTKYLGIFSTEIEESIQRAIDLTNSTLVWTERDFFNITEEKIIRSLNVDLLTAFKILRYPGGEVVGLSNFIEMLKKHLVTGTLHQVDPSFYVETAKQQLQQNFTVLEEPLTTEYASRYSINYIKDNGESLSEGKGDIFRNTQLNRGRVLNEDIKLSIDVDTLLSSTKNLKIANEGIGISALNPTEDATPLSVGSPRLLNIGDGGGYYLNLSSLSGELPLVANSILDSSYYLPDYHKAKIMSFNNKSFEATITASSLSDRHEFVSGDSGASSFEPMYFGLNLASVSSTYNDDPLVSNYTASYSRITNLEQVNRHVNNNAQSVSEFRIGYDDPLYRYILDTSSFNLTQEDFTIEGFKDNFSSVNYNFPKNIPFGIIILPVAGSKYNPLNGQSELISYDKDVLIRSLIFKPGINKFIDGRENGRLKTYNLYNKDGSKRIGLVEPEDVQSFGYEYDSTMYYNNFYNGKDYVSSIDPVSSFGVAYLLTEVLDYIAETTTSKDITWFDVYRRMPFNRFAELFYTSSEDIFESIKNGFRKNLKLGFVLKGLGNQQSVLLPDDERTIIKISERDEVSKQKMKTINN